MTPTNSSGSALELTHTQDELLTVRELGAMLKISPASVYRLVERRRVPFYRLPNKLRFRTSEIEGYLQANRVDVVH